MTDKKRNLNKCVYGEMFNIVVYIECILCSPVSLLQNTN